MLDFLDLPIADHHVGAAREDRPDQLRDVGGPVLVVGVGVDDHVRPELQGRVHPGLKSGCQALVVGQPDNVVHSMRSPDLDGPIAGPVVDQEPLDLLEAVHCPGQLQQYLGQSGLLVQARNLDHQLHPRRPW